MEEYPFRSLGMGYTLTGEEIKRREEARLRAVENRQMDRLTTALMFVGFTCGVSALALTLLAVFVL